MLKSMRADQWGILGLAYHPSAVLTPVIDVSSLHLPLSAGGKRNRFEGCLAPNQVESLLKPIRC